MAYKKPYKTISLFSGVMGLDLGFEKAGFDVVACVENDPMCVETIKVNRLRVSVISKDIREVSSKEILDVAGLKKREVFAVIGGPPCQAFSTAGSRKSLQDTRGNCILEFAKKVKELKPRFFLMENVRGLLSAPLMNPRDHGHLEDEFECLPGSAMKYLLELFKVEGYTVSFALFNSANYGVPQMRERMLFFGNRGKQRIPLPQPTHSEQGLCGTKKWRNIRSVFDELKGVKHNHIEFSEKRKRFYKLLKAGQNWRDLPEDLQEEAMGASYHLGGGKTGFYRRLSWSRPSPTIVTRPNMPATDLCHPEKLRPLSVEEYEAIQGFPKEWKLQGNVLDKYKQIGNAVPVGLGCAAGKNIKDFYEKKYVKEAKNGVSYSRYKGTTDIEFNKKFTEQQKCFLTV